MAEEKRRVTGATYTGTVKRYSSRNGYGFISVTDGEEDVFVHQNEILMEGFRKLETGQEVEFEFGVRDGKPNAFKVRVTGSGTAAIATAGQDQKRGSVKWFNVQKGFGFIVMDGDETNDIFVHIRECPGQVALQEGQRVRFSLDCRDEAKGQTTAVKVQFDGNPNLPTGCHQGTVKWFNVAKGFGFIIKDGCTEDDLDIFVHIRECPGQMPLQAGQVVFFEQGARKNGKGQSTATALWFPGQPRPVPGQQQGMMPQMGGFNGSGFMGQQSRFQRDGFSQQNGYGGGYQPYGGMGFRGQGMQHGNMQARPQGMGMGGQPAMGMNGQPAMGMNGQQGMGMGGMSPMGIVGTGAGNATGIVKWFNSEKGFGFISPSGGGGDVFVGQDAVIGGGILSEGDVVEYEPVVNGDRVKGMNVRPTSRKLKRQGTGGIDQNGMMKTQRAYWQQPANGMPPNGPGMMQQDQFYPNGMQPGLPMGGENPYFAAGMIGNPSNVQGGEGYYDHVVGQFDGAPRF